MRKALILILAALLAAPAAAASAQEVRGEWDMSVAELRAMVERLREDLFRPGDSVAGWNRGGANPDADLRARGADSHFFRVRSGGGESVVILTDRPLSSFAPAGWRVADTYGSAATRVENPFVQFEALSPRYVIGLRAGSERRGDVDCVASVANATLYERTGVPAGNEDAQIPLLFRVLLLAAGDQEVCTRYNGNAGDGYRALAFLPDGRSLPTLNQSDELITIVPAGPLDTLVTYVSVEGGT